MKRSIKIICLVICAYFFTPALQAQVLTDSVSVMISPGTNDAKAIGDVKAAIKAINSIHFIGYCSNHNVYLIYMDRKMHDAQVLLNDLKTTTGIATLSLKKGEVSKMLGMCVFSDPVDAQTIKKQSDH